MRPRSRACCIPIWCLAIRVDAWGATPSWPCSLSHYRRAKKDIKIYFGDVFISDGKKHGINYQFAATDRSSGRRFAVGTG